MDIDAYIESLMKTERPPKFPHSMYYTEGIKYLNLCLYQRALEFLDSAVKNDKTHVKSLLKRSKCFIALREYHKALDDANKALELCPNNIEAIDLKGQAQYLMGDFEGGYLTYLNGREMRPINKNFRLGKQLCREALDNSIDPPRKVNVDQQDVATMLKIKKDDKKFEKSLKHLKSKRDCFGKDKKFMKELMKNKNLASIRSFCEETIDYIKDCERFWAMQEPLKTRKKIPQIVRREVKKSEVASRQLYVCKAAISRAENYLKKWRIDDSLAEIEKMLHVVESLPKEIEEEKPKLKCDAFHLMSQAYKMGNNPVLSRRYLLKELELANDFNLTLPQTKAYHLLGEHYQRQGNVSRALQCYNKVSGAMDPDQIELFQDEVTAGDLAHLESAQEWMDSVVDGVRMSLRESIYAPIVDTMGELIKTINSNNDEDTNQSKQNIENSLEQEQKTTHEKADNGLDDSSAMKSSVPHETSNEFEENL